LLLFPPEAMKCTETKLVDKLKNGDAEAFRQLFEQYKDIVYGYSYVLAKSPVLAEEIVQEVFMKVWSMRAQLRTDCSFKSFIYTLTRHQVYNLLRKAAYDEKLKSEVFCRLPFTHQETEVQVLSAELDRMARKGIAALPPQRQLIFRMSREQGLAHEEIALQLGLSKNTVKDQMVKALKSLREYLRLHADVTFSLLYVLSSTTF
jgi:RNA polymerase sigma-70 factor (family 1)